MLVSVKAPIQMFVLVWTALLPTAAGLLASCTTTPGSVSALSLPPVASAVTPIPPDLSAADMPSGASSSEPTSIADGAPLTFDRAFAIAERRNVDLSLHRSAIERSRINYQGVAAGYAADWQAQFIGNLEPPLGSEISNSVGAYYDKAGVELRWTLPWWHKEGVKYDARAAQLDTAIAETDYAENERNLAVALLKAYAQVLLFEEQVRAATAQVRVDRARRDAMIQGKQIGQASDLQTTIQEANLQNEEATAAHLQDQLTSSRQALFELMNVPEANVKFCRNYFDFFSFDASSWNLDWALQEQTRSLLLLLAKQEIQNQKSLITWQPDLAVRGSFGREYLVNGANTISGANTSSTGTHDTLGIGVVLTVPFPNPPQAAAQRELTRHDTNDLLFRLDQTKANSVRTASYERERIAALAANLQVRRSAMESYSRQLAYARNAFALGTMTLLEVQAVEASVMQSTLQIYNDLAVYIDLVADYARLYGRPLPIPTKCVTR